MTTYVFDGSTNLEIPNFRPALDSIIINGVDIDDVASFTESEETVTLTLTSGVVLSLGGVIFSSLTNDNFDAAGGSDLVFNFGTAANNAALTGNIVLGLDGNDTVTATTDGSFLYGGEGTDRLEGGNFTDLTVYGGQGVDTVVGVGENSIVFGNADGDSITLVTAAGETATVFGGSDVVGTEDGDDTIAGAAGDDLIYGNAGDDGITGAAGEDTIFGGQGDDTIDGGAGDDVLYGNLGDDSIDGAAGDDVIFGGQDADTISGGAGDDAVYGNLGDDVLIVSAGVDTLVGGAGDDYIGGFTAGATVAGGDLVAGSVVYGGLGDDVINVEVIAGATASTATSIFGGNNLVGAADGDDFITVSGTNDFVSVYGNEGNDTIVGSEGSIEIFGGAGNDSLTGGSANDNVTNITGGLGNDTFVANTYATVAGAQDDGYSIVEDFTKGSDTIEFATDPTAFATITVGAATEINTVDAVFDAYAAQLTSGSQALAVVIQSGELAGHTVVLADTDGTDGADQVIVLNGAFSNLDLGDFT